jgi:hypothetical protein
MRRFEHWLAFVLVLVLGPVSFAEATEVRVLHDFEEEGELRAWEQKLNSAALSDRHVTHGRRSLRISMGEYLVNWSSQDWSGFDSLDADVFVGGDEPVTVTVLVGDQAWIDTGRDYWNRHNSTIMLRPGANRMSIPLGGMYRGEAGSRNNDIKRNIDLDSIRRFDLGFANRSGEGAIYIDKVRLVNESPPAGVLAFDLGPDDQSVFAGFTPIGPSTVYGRDGNSAGFRHAIPGGIARDSIFPTRLYQDFVGLHEGEFVVDVPNGTYNGWVVFEDLGYWGGETARYRRRVIEAEGRPVVVEEPGPAGESDYLFRFESIEPKPGDSLWELYAEQLFRPRRFQVAVNDGQLNLRFPAETFLNAKVAAIIIYPEGAVGAAEWVEQVERRNREEFESQAVFLGPHPKPLDVPADAVAQGWWLGFPSIEDEVFFSDAPGEAEGVLSRRAARGQRISYTFAIRPLTEQGGQPVSLVSSDLIGPNGSIPAERVDLRYVHHYASRGFNTIAYTIRPQTLRTLDDANLMLEKDLTRQFWVTVHVPDDAAPGTYTGELSLRAGPVETTLPLSVEVLDLELDEPDFLMGFYGLSVPRELPRPYEEALRELLALLRESGMNSFSGGPDLTFSGLDESGQPILGFEAADRFFRISREEGFTNAVFSYGGPGMVTGLHGQYVVGNAGRSWEEKTGRPFGELLNIVWSAVEEHAKQQQWPTILYNFTDEPRVLDQATEQLELMKLYREHAPSVKIGGSYSVHWDSDQPLDQVIQEIFRTLTWSAVNLHGQADIDRAQEYGSDLYIYNQGRSRFSFGAYQWAQMRKGVRGRIQWHTLALHGYQFFDLDGREPDTAIINWSSRGIIPNIQLAQCREGADDFRYAVTLWNLASRHEGNADADEAREWLQRISDSIPAGNRRVPDDFPGNEEFRERCIEYLQQVQSAAQRVADE